MTTIVKMLIICIKWINKYNVCSLQIWLLAHQFDWQNTISECLCIWFASQLLDGRTKAALILQICFRLGDCVLQHDLRLSKQHLEL